MLIETVLLGLLFLGGPLSIWYYGKRKNIGNINVKKNVKSSQVSTTKNWPLIINSAMLYALAYTVVYFIQEVLLTIPKVMYGLNATLLHNNATWEISPIHNRIYFSPLVHWG